MDNATSNATCEVYEVAALADRIADAEAAGDERAIDQLTRVKGTTRPGGANDGKKYVYALFIGGELRNVESRSFIPYPPMRPDDGTPAWLAEAAERHLAALTTPAPQPEDVQETEVGYTPKAEPVFTLAATGTYHWPGCGKAGAGVKLTLAQVAEATDGAGKPCGTCQPPAIPVAAGANEVAG